MDNAIGIIGGVGPYAGIDLVKKVFDHTNARSDQEHIALYLASCPSLIADRTEYLLHGGVNPAGGMYVCFEKLVQCGANTIAVACNTAHAPGILSVMMEAASVEHPQVRFINMIEETCLYLERLFPQGGKIGLLATVGTYMTGVYQDYLGHHPQFELVEPTLEGQRRLHAAIYDTGYGVKARFPVSGEARAVLLDESMRLLERNVVAMILGCTELPLALKDDMLPCELVDPTDCAARALVLAAAPEKFKE